MRRLVPIALTMIACRRDEPVARAAVIIALSLFGCRRDEAAVSADDTGALPPGAPNGTCASTTPTRVIDVPCALAALRASAQLARAKCGAVAAATVNVTFEQKGTVSFVDTEPPLAPPADACVHGIFAAARIPPFESAPRTIAWPLKPK